MSGLGAARCPRLQKGKVRLSRGRHNGSIRVLFDGYQSPATAERTSQCDASYCGFRLPGQQRMSPLELAFEAEIDLTYVGGIGRGKRNSSLLVMARIPDANVMCIT